MESALGAVRCMGRPHARLRPDNAHLDLASSLLINQIPVELPVSLLSKWPRDQRTVSIKKRSDRSLV